MNESLVEMLTFTCIFRALDFRLNPPCRNRLEAKGSIAALGAFGAFSGFGCVESDSPSLSQTSPHRLLSAGGIHHVDRNESRLDKKLQIESAV